MDCRLDDLRLCFGCGVAGNFAGHLEQAGEAADFEGVEADLPQAPKGIFPYYVPGSESFLGDFPLSNDRIVLPVSDVPLNLQIEPEAGLLCEVAYTPQGTVEGLQPIALGAFNDCSIRRPGAVKISEKKNWGAHSKGVAAAFIPVTDLSPGGPTRDLRIASFLCRDGQTHAYGVDSPVVGYSYYGTQLLDWLVDRLNNQPGVDGTPLEDVGAMLTASGRPARMLIGIGATRYTELGESTFLQDGDQSIVVLYDGGKQSQDELAHAVAAEHDERISGASILRQTVCTAAGGGMALFPDNH